MCSTEIQFSCDITVICCCSFGKGIKKKNTSSKALPPLFKTLISTDS